MTEKTGTQHPDYEAAFQAAEYASSKYLGCLVDPEPLYNPIDDGAHTWAFVPQGPDKILDAAGENRHTERVEVQIEAEDVDGRIPVHFTRGPLDDPAILRTVEVGDA